MSSKKTLALFAALCLLLTSFAGCASGQKPSAASSSAAESAAGDGESQVELSAIYLWQGSGVWRPDDEINNPVAQVIREKTGVTLKTEYITTDSSEKLNLIFASGDMPDIISGWFGGFSDYPAMTRMIKKAAKEGLLTPLDDYLDKYPNVKYAVSAEALPKDFYEVDMMDPAFGGKTYVVPWETPYADADMLSYGMAAHLWAREDIVTALGIDPQSVDTSEKMRDFLRQIKGGGFEDISGNNVIPYGVLRGFMLYAPGNSYKDYTNLTPYVQMDGKWRYKLFSPMMDEYVKYMRSLVSESLLDNEHFSQTDAILKEKVATGRYGVIASHHQRLYETINTTLLTTNPEMKYVAVGPIKNPEGDPVYECYVDKVGPSPCIILSSTCKDPDAAVRFLNFIQSDEGQELVLYGVEGTHYTKDADGKPRPSDEWLTQYAENPRNLWNEGIRSIYSMFISTDKRVTLFGEFNYGARLVPDPTFESMEALTTFPIKKGFRVDYLGVTYPDFTDAMDMISSLPSETTAFFAQTDEEALAILDGIRSQAIAGGIQQFEDFINAEAAKRDDIIS